MIDILSRLEEQGGLRVVRTIDELRDAFEGDSIAAVLHFEGAEPIDPGLESLADYYALGLRSLGIVWSRPNAFGTGVPFAFRRSPDTGPGLTDAGIALVRACNELGILLDCSHINAQGFRDVARHSRAPLVATHSNAYSICASTRNLTDWMLDAVRDTRGVVGVNFAVMFLSPEGSTDSSVPLESIVDHIVYMCDRIGIEHVALGSDFDGSRVPSELADVAGMPRLFDSLRRRGFDEGALAMIAHENWMRVIEETWNSTNFVNTHGKS
jgi:membrane dipeptidase